MNSGEIDEREFGILQDLHLKVIKLLANVDCKMFQNPIPKIFTGKDKRDKENLKNERRLMICSLFPVCYIVCCQMDKLQDIYYQPHHLWKGQKAIRKLQELSKEKPSVIKRWLSRQAIWQVHLPRTKYIEESHYEVMIPNQMHQFDLLYMPSDTLYGNNYKYILSGIDAASRYKVARPMRTKQAKDVTEMIADIYKVCPLTYLKTFQCDNGSKFKGEVTRLLEKHEA